MSTHKAKKGKTLKMGRSYSDVSDLVRDTLDPESADDFDEYTSERSLINGLTTLRCAEEISQVQMAARMGCGQPKISKMEQSADADLNFGDVVKYAVATGSSMQISLLPAKGNRADHIRFHLACIKYSLDELAKIAGDDRRDGVEAMAIETIGDMISMIERSVDKLPDRPQPVAPVCVEAAGGRGRRLSSDGLRRVRRGVKEGAEA